MFHQAGPAVPAHCEDGVSSLAAPGQPPAGCSTAACPRQTLLPSSCACAVCFLRYVLSNVILLLYA